MVEYLDGGRIQGSSTSLKTTTFTSDFTSTSGWTSTNSAFVVNTSENAIIADNTQTTTNLQVGYDLGSGNELSNTTWVIDFDLKITALTSSSSLWTMIGMYNSDTTVDDDQQQDFIGISLLGENSQGTSTNAIHLCDNDDTSPTGTRRTTWGEDTLVGSPQYYLRMTRTAADGLKLEGFSSAARTGTPTKTGSITFAGTPQNLRYFKVQNRTAGSGGELDIKIENVKIWDGITDPTLNEMNDITKVPLGTRFEDISTRKIYRFAERTPTFEDDFSGSDNWVDNGDDVAVNTSTNVIDWAVIDDSNSDGCSIDLTTVSDTKWAADFDITYNTVTTGSSANGNYLLVCLDSITAVANTTGHDALGVAFEIDSTPTNQAAIGAFSCDNLNLYDAMEFNTPTGTISLFTETAQASETHYVRMIRDGSTFTVKIYSDATRETLVESESVDADDNGTVSGLRYFRVTTTRDNTNDHTFNGTIDNVKFYNGIASPANTWFERGTAV